MSFMPEDEFHSRNNETRDRSVVSELKGSRIGEEFGVDQQSPNAKRDDSRKLLTGAQDADSLCRTRRLIVSGAVRECVRVLTVRLLRPLQTSRRGNRRRSATRILPRPLAALRGQRA